MAEDYRPSLNRLKNKSGDGEDPVLVAQRFLNIFRQLHIFDEKRHAEFKAQILALSPEIRNAFGILPGGQALQEFADEIVKEAGGQVSPSDTDPATGNILSAAINEAKPTQKVVSTGTNQTAPQIIQTVGGKVVADEAFAQTLAQSFAKALQFSDANKKEDIKELIHAIRESKTTIDRDSFNNESKLIADEDFAQTLAESFARALQFSDVHKQENFQELIKAIRESKSAAAENNGGESRLVADEDFAQMLAQAFTQALEKANANKKGDMQDLIDAIKDIRLSVPAIVPQPVAPSDVVSKNAGASETSQFNIDANFAQILAQSFASALEISNADRKSEMRELIKAIRENGETARAVQFPENLKVVADESFAHTLSQTFSDALENINQNHAMKFGEPLKVIADETFAATIAQSLSSAMASSEQKRLEEIEKLLQTLQNQQPHFAYAASEDSATLTAAPIFNNDNLGKTIADALSHAVNSSKAETLELTQAIKDTQNELTKALLQNLTPNAANNNGNAAANLPIDEIVGKMAEVQSGFLKEMTKHQAEEFSSVISAALKESQELSSKTIIDAIKAFQEENLRLIRSMPLQISNIPPANESDSSNEFQARGNMPSNDKKRKASASPIPLFTPEDATDFARQEQPQGFLDSSLFGEGGFENNVSTEESLTGESDFSAVSDESPDFEEETTSDTFANNKKPVRNSLFNDVNRSIRNSRMDFDRYIKSEFESSTIEEEQISGADWGFSTEEENTTPPQSSDYKGWNPEADNQTDTQDWEWEYEEDTASQSADGEDSAEWEWVYEEEPAEGQEGQDWEWEWEYEEDTAAEEETTAADEVVTTEEQISSGVIDTSITETSVQSEKGNENINDEAVQDKISNTADIEAESLSDETSPVIEESDVPAEDITLNIYNEEFKLSSSQQINDNLLLEENKSNNRLKTTPISERKPKK